jgi:hypothetical protein
MPAPKGGIAREGRHDVPAQGGAEGQEIENQSMRDGELEEKRKREGRQGGAEDSPKDDRIATAPSLHRQKLRLGRSHRLWL